MTEVNLRSRQQQERQNYHTPLRHSRDRVVVAIDFRAGLAFVPFAALTAALGVRSNRAAAECTLIAAGARRCVARNIGTTCAKRPKAVFAGALSLDGVVRTDGL